MRSKLHTHWITIRSTMYAMDWYFIFLIAIYALLTLIWWSDIPGRWTLIIENTCFALICFGIVHFFGRTTNRRLHILRQFYVIPFIYPLYAQIFMLLPYIRTTLYDRELIALDHALCGVNPTQWLQHFSHPLLTEYLQVCYVAFFFLPGIHGILLYRAHRHAEFMQFSRLMVFSFFVSYLAYFGFPAVGPRFTLHDFSSIDLELPGIWVTSFLRERVNIGGGVIPGSLNPASLVNRDCMPSGHTMMTLVNIILVWRFRSPAKWFFTIIGSSLIVATLYLRYHYVVDVLAGIACALLMIPLEPRVNALLKKHGLILSE